MYAPVCSVFDVCNVCMCDLCMHECNVCNVMYVTYACNVMYVMFVIQGNSIQCSACMHVCDACYVCSACMQFAYVMCVMYAMPWDPMFTHVYVHIVMSVCNVSNVCNVVYACM